MAECVWPEWVEKLKSHYLAGSSSFFLINGNVDDIIGFDDGKNYDLFSISDFLAGKLFGNYDLVLHYDMGRGLRPHPGGDQKRLDEMNALLNRLMGGIADLGPEPERVMRLLDRLIELMLVGRTTTIPKKTAFIFNYADMICPPGDRYSQFLATFLNWARSPVVKRVNMVFILVAGSLGSLNPALVQSGHTTDIRVPMPNLEERKIFIDRLFPDIAHGVERMAKLSAGLTLTNLGNLLRLVRKLENTEVKEEPKSIAADEGKAIAEAEEVRVPEFMRKLIETKAKDSTEVDPHPDNAPKKIKRSKSDEILVKIKKQLIESQCPGLLEFVEPTLDLSLVAGHTAAKNRLADDARLIREGHLEAVPMGYLICGPVGVGKTFISMCYAGDVGIPCVTIRNFRSKYVGETEANLEKILNVLRELGPVAVIIDEADAAVGDRGAGGDSGTSQRVFAKIASQMGNTEYRGKIIWFLLTCRPDLLPIDLKRQGRCEEHIPLFYPETPGDLRGMFLAMGKKLKLNLKPEALPDMSTVASLSGADIEGVLTRVRRDAILAGKDIDKDLVSGALSEFRSPRGLEHELQILAAILECSDMKYLSPSTRKLVDERGFDVLSQRFRELQAQVR
ncbi:MAG: ATP-binding protein [Planctomycetes bacterium]|nr:ATP-binding protein [Planctomycetota bacterium]